MRLSPLLLLLFFSGCESVWKGADNDGDGVSAADGDCWDATEGPVSGTSGADIYPGAPDIWYDGVDSDCAGNDDFDADGDGYVAGSGGATLPSDSLPDATRVGYGDCDDTDGAVNPAATEVCDGIDNNCDGVVDEGVQIPFYVDADADGFGEVSVASVEACEAPVGYAGNNDDCNDADGAVNPGAAEVCDEVDNNCDGNVDEGFDPSDYFADADGDGYGDPAVAVTAACEAPLGYVSDATDCDDTSEAVNSGATEVCDEIDNNCDGDVDEGLPLVTWYADYDGDGWGLVSEPLPLCEGEDPPSGYAANLGDCDDGDSAIYPGASEDDCADPVDYNCDGSVGYADADADGYVACQECDDANPAANPGATEVCDTVDNNCDGVVDEDAAADAVTWYADTDTDTYGDVAITSVACAAPSGYVADATDCDDADGTVNPDAAEVCDEVDNNCDGVVDPSTATDAATWYADTDSDTYGNAAVTDVACEAPSGYVADATDCDDADGTVNPDAAEVCDEVDNNCDGVVDPSTATDAATWYRDADTDTYGDVAITSVACAAPSGYVADATDCDDADGDINPGATEVCDGDDNDCDGTADEDGVCDTGGGDGGGGDTADTGTGEGAGTVFYVTNFGDGGTCAPNPFQRSDGRAAAAYSFAAECGAYVFGGGNASGAPVTLAASFSGFIPGETYTAELEVINLTTSALTLYADFGGGAVQSLALPSGATGTLVVSYVATGGSATLRTWTNGATNYDVAVTGLVVTY